MDRKNASTSYFKVGLATVVGLAIFFYLLSFINGFLLRGHQYTVLFKDARGIKPAEIVRMAGIDVGQIGTVGLTSDNEAKITVRMNRGVRVPLDSVFIIRGALIGNENQMIIMPSKSPQELPDGAVITGNAPDPLGDALAKAPQLTDAVEKALARAPQLLDTTQKTLLQSQRLIQNLTKTTALLQDPRRIAKIDATLDNLESSTAGLPHLEAQVDRQLTDISSQTSKLIGGFDDTRATANRALGNAEKLTSSLNDAVAENRKTLHSLLSNANEISDSLAGLTEQAKTAFGDKDLKATLSTTTKNLAATTANLQAISTKLDATASDVQRLADDPRLNANVRETVDNLRASSESVRNLAQRLEGIHIPGEKRRSDNAANTTPAPPRYFSSTSLLEPGFVFDSLYDTNRERLRFDADYTLLIGKPGTFYRAGIYDATYNNRLNLEAGQALFGNRADYRYGIIAGKFGAGIDFRAGPLDFRFDAYDPNHGTVNARVKANLSKDAAITAGVDSLGSGNRPTVGIQIRK